MIKRISLILSMAIICCAFTACGKDDTVSSQAEKNTEARQETDGFDDKNNDNQTTSESNNMVEEMVTEAENAVDDLVSEGENIMTDAGGALEDMVDGTSTEESSN